MVALTVSRCADRQQHAGTVRRKNTGLAGGANHQRCSASAGNAKRLAGRDQNELNRISAASGFWLFRRRMPQWWINTTECVAIGRIDEFCHRPGGCLWLPEETSPATPGCRRQRLVDMVASIAPMACIRMQMLSVKSTRIMVDLQARRACGPMCAG